RRRALFALLREKLSLPGIEAWSNSTRTVFINALFLIAVIVVFPVLVAQFRRDEVVVEAISVPSALNDQGLTADVAASRIWDGLQDVAVRAGSSKETIKAIPNSRRVEFSFPDSGFSIESLVYHLRRLFNAYETRIGGEITCAESNCDRSGMQLRLRVIRGDTIDIVDLPPMGTMSERDYFDKGAAEVMAYLDPFIAISAAAEDQPVRAAALARRMILAGNKDAKWAYNLIGLIRAKSGDMAAAIPEFRGALALDPGFLPAHANLGNALLRSGDQAGAAKELAFVEQRDPRNTAMLQGLSELALAKGDIDGAVNQLMKAASYDPENPLYYAKAGNIELEHGRKEAGRKLLQKALDFDPADANAFALLAASYIAESDTASAEKIFRDRADFLPNDAHAQASYAQLLPLSKKWDVAVERYARAIELDPDNAGYLVDYARCLQALNRQDEALAALQKASTLEPDRAETYFALGDSLRALNRKPEAVAAYRRFLDLDKTGSAYRTMAQVWIRNLSG
ncbi:MAG: tetratricopeptide repeat protein, partial [Methylobacterium mesophilicum]|nr:tetratricopeptide repeat protein [Methylobacterium mesophilicum]